MSLHLRTLQGTRAVYGMCKGCFDGKRTFFVMNHRCKLAAYAYAGDESNENTSASQEEVEDCGEEERRQLRQVALVPTRSRHVHHIECIRSGGKDGVRDLLLVLFVDENTFTHTWMILYWHDTCEAFVELNALSSISSFSNSNTESAQQHTNATPKRLEIACTNVVTFKNRTSRSKEGRTRRQKGGRDDDGAKDNAETCVHVLCYTILRGSWHLLQIETSKTLEHKHNNSMQLASMTRHRERERDREFCMQAAMDACEVASPDLVRRLLEPSHIETLRLRRSKESVQRSIQHSHFQESRDVSVSVVGMNLLKSGREVLLAVLCRSHDPPIEVTDLHCLKLNLNLNLRRSRGQDQNEDIGNRDQEVMMESGPWKLRNMDPTTTCTCLCETENGEELLILSAQSVTRVCNASAGFGIDILKKEKKAEVKTCFLKLDGIPTCATFVREQNMAIVGDTGGGVHCIQLTRSGIVHTRLDTNTCAPGLGGAEAEVFPIPSAIQCLSQAKARTPTEVTLTVLAGSRYGATTAFDVHLGSRTGIKRQIGDRRKLFDHAGPVVDAVVAQETGFGEEDVLVTCRGVAQQSNISKSYIGCSLEADIEAKEVIPADAGVPALLGVHAKGQLAGNSDARYYLLFSFEAARVTHVLDMSEDTFVPATIPGLDQEAYTLAANSPCSGFITQVTQEEIRLIDLSRGRLHASVGGDVFPGAKHFEHAQVSNARVALASQSYIQAFQVRNQKIVPVNRVRMEDNISALQLKEIEIDADDVTLILVGQWHSNAVIILEFQGMDELLRIDTFESQPRSFSIFSSEDDMSFLYVGLSNGKVHYYPFSTEDGALCIEVEEEDCVQIGNSAVSFRELPLEESEGRHARCIYAHSDVDVVFQAGPCSGALRQISEESMDDVEDKALKLRANRVAGSQNITSIAPIKARGMAAGVAWLDSRNCLRIGSIKGEAVVQTHSVGIGRTVKKIAYHRVSKSIVAISEDESGMHWLDVVDSRTMEQKTGSRLHENHFHTALSVETIPSDSPKFIDGKGLESVVTGSVIIQDAKVAKDNTFTPSTVHSIISFYSLEMLLPRNETDIGTDRKMQLLGTCPIPDLCNCMGTITCDDRLLLLVGCNESLVLLEAEHLDRLGRSLNDLDERVKGMESVSFPNLMKENVQPNARKRSKEGSTLEVEKLCAPLIRVTHLAKRPVARPVTNMHALGTEMLCSDASGGIVIYSIVKVASEDELAIEPITCYQWDHCVHTLSSIGGDTFMCSDSANLFLLERNRREEAAFEKDFEEVSAHAYEAGHPQPTRSEYPLASPMASVESQPESQLGGPSEKKVVPLMNLRGGCKVDGSIIAAMEGNLRVRCTRGQQVKKRDVIGQPRKVGITTDGQIICIDVLKKDAWALLLKLQQAVDRGLCFGKQNDRHNDTFTNICHNHKQLWDLTPGPDSDDSAKGQSPCIDGDFVLSFLEQICESRHSEGFPMKLAELLQALNVLSLIHT